jgi:hypothetical protein
MMIHHRALDEFQCQTHDLRVSLGATQETELPEHVQHGGVLGRHFRGQLFEARAACQRSQMPHENRPDSLGLIGADHDESDFGLAGPDNNIASTADDDGVPAFVDFRDKRDMTFEIDIQEERLLPLRKAFLWYEEARRSDCVLVLPIAPSISGPSSGRSARISVERPSRRCSTAAFSASLDMRNGSRLLACRRLRLDPLRDSIIRRGHA